jgi:hypothetical protein
MACSGPQAATIRSTSALTARWGLPGAAGVPIATGEQTTSRRTPAVAAARNTRPATLLVRARLASSLAGRLTLMGSVGGSIPSGRALLKKR